MVGGVNRHKKAHLAATAENQILLIQTRKPCSFEGGPNSDSIPEDGGFSPVEAEH